MDSDEFPRVPFCPGWKDNIAKLGAILFTACAIRYIKKEMKDGIVNFTLSNQENASLEQWNFTTGKKPSEITYSNIFLSLLLREFHQRDY